MGIRACVFHKVFNLGDHIWVCLGDIVFLAYITLQIV